MFTKIQTLYILFSLKIGININLFKIFTVKNITILKKYQTKV